MRKITAVIVVFLLLQSTTAFAVVLRHNQGGSVLIFPFYNVENGWDSLITVSTATRFLGNSLFVEHRGSFRVRIRDAVNGQVIKRFTVYNTLTVNWRASLGKNSNGQAIFRVAEGDCLLTDTNEVFEGKNAAIELSSTTGIIEVYAIGQINPSLTCKNIADNWKPGGQWALDPTDGVFESTPLKGEIILVNVDQGLAVSSPAIALAEFSDKLQHQAPDVDRPTLADATPVARLQNGELIIPNSGQGIDAVALVLGIGEEQTLASDVVILDDIGARTDWIISYPLAGYQTYRPFTVELNDQTVHCESFGRRELENRPTVQVNVETAMNSLVSEGAGQILGGGEQPFPSLPPPIDSRVELCRAVNIISFEGKPSILIPDNSIFHSDLSGVIASPTSSLTWKLIEPVFPSESGIRRPVLAYSLTTFVNRTLNGGAVLANYAILRAHRQE